MGEEKVTIDTLDSNLLDGGQVKVLFTKNTNTTDENQETRAPLMNNEEDGVSISYTKFVDTYYKNLYIRTF